MGGSHRASKARVAVIGLAGAGFVVLGTAISVLAVGPVPTPTLPALTPLPTPNLPIALPPSAPTVSTPSPAPPTLGPLPTPSLPPLLIATWLLLFGRTWSEARRSRDAQTRLAIAHDLGLSPRELLSVSTKALFKPGEEAAFDELAGVFRRAAGISALDREIARARRQRTPLALAFIDVDGLKQANDKRGHKAGDDLLRGLATLLRTGLRGQDLVMRYGGDE